MSNKETITWENIPDEVRCIIFKYLPETTLVWLNKTYYNQHHAVIASMIKPSRYQQYVTNMIIRDASFSFNYVMRENIVLWFKKMVNNKKHRFGNKTYSSFLAFLMEFSIASGAEKCRRIIEEVATEVIGPKWHKRNRSTSYRKTWSN